MREDEHVERMSNSSGQTNLYARKGSILMWAGMRGGKVGRRDDFAGCADVMM